MADIAYLLFYNWITKRHESWLFNRETYNYFKYVERTKNASDMASTMLGMCMGLSLIIAIPACIALAWMFWDQAKQIIRQRFSTTIQAAEA